MPNYKARNTMQKKHVIHRMVNKTIFVEGGCWLWQGSLRDGYGQINVIPYRENDSVHRLSAHFFLGFNYDLDKQINHKLICPNRNCWNPEHIYIGNQYQNVRDMLAVTR